MVGKDLIVRELGEDDLLLPHLIIQALDANNQVKFFLTLLQESVYHADHINLPVRSLISERKDAGIENGTFDEVIPATSSTDDGWYRIPHLDAIFTGISESLCRMVNPFHNLYPYPRPDFFHRISSLLKVLPDPHGPVLLKHINEITSADRSGPDSIHLLVMDIHKALLSLQKEVATDIIDGAHCFMINPEDRPFIQAFMEGLNRTAPLRFQHPGLGTTVTRSGEFLLIQNDIGLTDAHVLIVRIRDLNLAITYTDIHKSRLLFFQSMLNRYQVIWSDSTSRTPEKKMEKEAFFMSTGIFQASRSDELVQFLSWLGSRIVFLIDWNKARKSLRKFLPNKDAISVLAKAAERDLGHRGYLVLGGEKLIFEILESETEIPLRYGEPLFQRLGREKCSDFFIFVIGAAKEGLLKKRSTLLIKDSIRAELLRQFHSTKETLFDICIEHASYAIEIAELLLAQVRAFPDSHVNMDFFSKRAKEWERKADEQIMAMRNLSKRMHSAESFIPLLNEADDAVDALEEACFLYSLIKPCDSNTDLLGMISRLIEATLKSCQEYLRTIIMAKHIFTLNNQENIQDFLRAADEVIRIEEECDAIFRKIQQLIFSSGNDSSILLMYSICQNIEASNNALMKTIFVIRDDFLDTMMR